MVSDGIIQDSVPILTDVNGSTMVFAGTPDGILRDRVSVTSDRDIGPVQKGVVYEVISAGSRNTDRMRITFIRIKEIILKPVPCQITVH